LTEPTRIKGGIRLRLAGQVSRMVQVLTTAPLGDPEPQPREVAEIAQAFLGLAHMDREFGRVVVVS